MSEQKMRYETFRSRRTPTTYVNFVTEARVERISGEQRLNILQAGYFKLLWLFLYHFPATESVTGEHKAHKSVS